MEQPLRWKQVPLRMRSSLYCYICSVYSMVLVGV